MLEIPSVKVSSRYQISLPSVARQQLNIQTGDRLLIDVQDGALILIPQPLDYVEYLAGLHSEIWSNIDTTEYMERERNAWTQSDND